MCSCSSAVCFVTHRFPLPDVRNVFISGRGSCLPCVNSSAMIGKLSLPVTVFKEVLALTVMLVSCRGNSARDFGAMQHPYIFPGPFISTAHALAVSSQNCSDLSSRRWIPRALLASLWNYDVLNFPRLIADTSRVVFHRFRV